MISNHKQIDSKETEWEERIPVLPRKYNVSCRKYNFKLYHLVLLLLGQIALGIILLVVCIHYTNDLPETDEETQSAFVNILKDKPNGERNISSATFEESVTTTREFQMCRTRYDSKRIIRIYDFYHLGDKWEDLVENRYHVCVAIHSTIERLYWLPTQLSKWTGPLSIAIYIRTDEEWVVLQNFLSYIQNCYSDGWKRVVMHVAFPANATFHLSTDQVLDRTFTSLSCTFTNPEEHLNKLLTKYQITSPEKLALLEVYPQNHIRNIARKACGRDWVITLDIDTFLQERSADALERFYNTHQNSNLFKRKDAFVIPVFELQENKPFPKTKEELVKYFNEGSARQYHGLNYPILHEPTNYQRWAFTNLKEEPIKVSHSIDRNRTKYYEPFFIASDTIPPFDERLLGYGATRTAQFYESFVAGWNFTVLTPIFAIHWSFLSRSTLISPKKGGTGANVRNNQTKANVQLFHRFMKEWKLKRDLNIF